MLADNNCHTSHTLQVEDHEIADVASVSAGNDPAVGKMISEALEQVGKRGVITIERGNSVVNTLQIVEGMKFDRGYLSPYFVTDRRRMIVELQNCKVRLLPLFRSRMLLYGVISLCKFH